jgi:hypothetical protein
MEGDGRDNIESRRWMRKREKGSVVEKKELWVRKHLLATDSPVDSAFSGDE